MLFCSETFKRSLTLKWFSSSAVTEYGAPMTTSETYCRNTASGGTPSVLLSGELGLEGGTRGPGEPAGQGSTAGASRQGDPQTPQQGKETTQ